MPVAYVCGMLMSPRLWLGFGRSFPRAPILPGFNFDHDFLISIALAGTLALSIITSNSRSWLAVSVVLTIVLVFLDQARLQPWVYQYAIMLSLLALARPDATNPKAILAANQFVVAALYFWSGLQKLSWAFIHEVVPTLIESSGLRLSPRYLTAIALTIAIFETLIGIGLLLPKTRRVAVVMACFMHSAILFTFILSGRNTVVWPWNVAMMMITAILFWRNGETPFEQLLRQRRDGRIVAHLPKIALLICGLLPALSFVGWWDLYLSGALYSGKTPVAVMRISKSQRDRLPPGARDATFTTSRGELMLPFYEWSLAELNVPPYPEVRVYRQIARELCRLDSDLQANALIVKGRPAARDGRNEVTFTTCSWVVSKHFFNTFSTDWSKKPPISLYDRTHNTATTTHSRE